ncbi:MAG: peptidylprolyl isomerase, partial [Bellilinea sp.]
PIETSFGWHIIQLLGKEQRPATSDQLDQIKQTKFSEWLTSVKTEMEIEKFDNWVGKVPTTPVTPSSFLTQ